MDLLVFECDCVVYQNSRSNDKLQKVRIYILGNLIGYKKKEKDRKMGKKVKGLLQETHCQAFTVPEEKEVSIT